SREAALPRASTRGQGQGQRVDGGSLRRLSHAEPRAMEMTSASALGPLRDDEVKESELEFVTKSVSSSSVEALGANDEVNDHSHGVPGPLGPHLTSPSALSAFAARQVVSPAAPTSAADFALRYSSCRGSTASSRRMTSRAPSVLTASRRCSLG